MFSTYYKLIVCVVHRFDNPRMEVNVFNLSQVHLKMK